MLIEWVTLLLFFIIIYLYFIFYYFESTQIWKQEQDVLLYG